jgi:hypothetical protein
MRPRITILGILGVVLAVALALAAVRSGSEVWVAALSLVLLTWLSASLLGAIFRQAKARAFWTGFAVFGWVYFLFVHTSLVSTPLYRGMAKGLDQFIEAAWTFTPVALPSDRLARLYRFEELAESKARVRVICDLILNLAFGLTGGFLAQWFAARTESERQAGTPFAHGSGP